MRVLWDHNLPARLLPVLRSWAWVTRAEHVADLGWADADDRFIWKATSTQPLLLRVGNCSTADLEKHFVRRAGDIAMFAADASKGLLLVESAP